MSISINKFIEVAAKPHCCGFPMHRGPKYVLLREPAIAFRLLSFTCQVCKRMGVSPADLKANVHRALRVARMVRPPGDLFQLIKKDQRDTKKSKGQQDTEA